MAEDRLVAFRPFSRKNRPGLPPFSRNYNCLACFDPPFVAGTHPRMLVCVVGPQENHRTTHAGTTTVGFYLYPLQYIMSQPSAMQQAPRVSKPSSVMLITNSSSLFLAVLGGVLAGCWWQLAGTPHEPHLRLLETFAYGTYAEALAKADQLPKLTSAQVRMGASFLACSGVDHRYYRI